MSRCFAVLHITRLKMPKAVFLSRPSLHVLALYPKKDDTSIRNVQRATSMKIPTTLDAPFERRIFPVIIHRSKPKSSNGLNHIHSPLFNSFDTNVHEFGMAALILPYNDEIFRSQHRSKSVNIYTIVKHSIAM